MKSFSKVLLVTLCLGVLNSCASVTIDKYADNEPRLIAEEFFSGRLNAHGIVKDRSGQVIRYFSATIDADWTDGVGTLDERFVFDDGEHQTRVWTLRPDKEGTYLATAGDVQGSAIVKVAGNSMFLDYILRIPYGDDTIDVHIDDRMYLVSDTVLLNESVMFKWGFRVGQITLVIEKLPLHNKP